MKKEARKLYVELRDALEEAGEVPCQNAPDIFFADEDDIIGAAAKGRYARTLCNDCPVRTLCAAYAIEANELHGIWGGLGVHDRRIIRNADRLASRAKS